MASIEKRGKNSYRLVASAGRDVSGKQIRPTKTISVPDGMTEKQREKHLNKEAVLFDQEVENGTYLDGAKITFSEFVEIWFDRYARKTLVPSTLKNYQMRLEQRIIPAIGHLKLSKIQPHHLMEFYDNLREGGMRLDMRYTPSPALVQRLEAKRLKDLVKLSGLSPQACRAVKRGNSVSQDTADKMCATLNVDVKEMFTTDREKKLSEKTIQHHHGTISSVLSKAVKWQVLTSNPALRVDFGKREKYKPAYYDDEQVATMLAALENEPLRYKAMIYFAIDTGLRRSEVTGLQWADIDFDKRTAIVDKQRQYVSGYGILIDTPKTESGERTVTLSKMATEMLRRYRSHQKEDLLKLGVAWDSGFHVFLNEDGSAMHPSRPYGWFTRFLKRHDLPKITFHQLRHTNASLMIADGVDIVTVSGRLGHADKNVTLSTYSHMIKSREALVANSMDKFYTQNISQSEKIG